MYTVSFVIARRVSDEAIQLLLRCPGLLRVARNDGVTASCKLQLPVSSGRHIVVTVNQATGASFVSIEFLVTSFIVIVSPGTGVLYTLAAGLSRGSRASVVAAFGCTIGIVPHMAAAILGLAALLHTSALAFQTFKYLGVAYLLYMAWNTLRARGALRVEQEIDTRSAVRVTVTAILINILNPKLSIFFLAFLPQFVSAGDPEPLWRMLALSGIFMLMTFVVFVGYGLFAASVRDHVISRPRVLTWMRRSFAAAFVALGAKLAFADR
jgi:threonine/homoserine/homoserine lactone efflux protein